MKNAEKKYFNQLSGARSTRKLVKIHNNLAYNEGFDEVVLGREKATSGFLGCLTDSGL